MTFCEFVEVSECKIASLKISVKSKYNSAYYFTEEGVYRYSNHWGRVGDCRWRLKIDNNQKVNQIYRIGYARWTDFTSLNENMKKFYIDVDFKHKNVHIKEFKSGESEEEKNIKLKTLDEAIKCSKSIQKIFNEELWTKHLSYDSIEHLRKHFIDELIFTNKTFHQIRLDYLKQYI